MRSCRTCRRHRYRWRQPSAHNSRRSRWAPRPGDSAGPSIPRSVRSTGSATASARCSPNGHSLWGAAESIWASIFSAPRSTSSSDADLDDGIKLYAGVPAIFVEDSLQLKLSTNVVGIFATYGVTDRLDVGVAVPVVHTELEARIASRVGANSGTVERQIRFSRRRPASGSATGIGDVVIRGRYNFWRAAGGGIAAGVDLRVPTGDEENLLGVAGMQTKLYAAVSSAHGRLSPHVNFGYTISGESDAAQSSATYLFAPSDEFNYAGGVDVAITPRLTVASDIVGRTMRDFLTAVPVPAGGGGLFTSFDNEETNFNQLLGSVGVKFNPFGQSLIAVNVLFPLDDHGLRDNLTWLVGFEYSFALRSK